MANRRLDLEMEKTMLRGKELLNMTISKRYYPILKRMLSYIDGESRIEGEHPILVPLHKFRGSYKTFRGYVIAESSKALLEKYPATKDKFTYWLIIFVDGDDEALREFGSRHQEFIRDAVKNGRYWTL